MAMTACGKPEDEEMKRRMSRKRANYEWEIEPHSNMVIRICVIKPGEPEHFALFLTGLLVFMLPWPSSAITIG
jgi:hypothetical protein